MSSSSNAQLLCFHNWEALEAPHPENGEWAQRLIDAGFDGIQFGYPWRDDRLAMAREAGLRVCGSGRVNIPADADLLAARAGEAGLECMTLHVGWGYEDDAEASVLIESVLQAEQRHHMPLYVETHRATLFQDIWRSVQWIRRFPTLRFNADFSHWYTGLEMVYGDFDRKLEYITPVIERTLFLHGRIGNPGCMQVELGPIEHARTLPFVQHFQKLWTAVFLAFQQRATPGRELIFTAELLSSEFYYARTFGGVEESDRWGQSLIITQLARECFASTGYPAVHSV